MKRNLLGGLLMAMVGATLLLTVDGGLFWLALPFALLFLCALPLALGELWLSRKGFESKGYRSALAWFKRGKFLTDVNTGEKVYLKDVVAMKVL